MKSKNTYIIGEIGQNHNGSIALAKLMIELMTTPVEEKLFELTLKGIDAVKLTKRDLNQELSLSQMASPYTGKNSFGASYGEHRAALELSDEEHFEAYKHAKSYGMDFVETLCAPACLSLLKLFSPDRLKVASRDLTNLPLLHALAETKIPIIVSTGMAGNKELDAAVEVITKYHNNLSILHCISQYPTEPQNVNLHTITYLKKYYRDYIIGYSDHTIGISAPVAAVALGAEIIEKHITLDRRMRGTDQSGSLEADGVKRMVRDIRLTEMSLGVEDIFISESTNGARRKLERSIATKVDLNPGDLIQEGSLFMLSPGDGYNWAEKRDIIGSKVTRPIKANEVIYPENIEQ